jgi:RNA polymerase sigma factor for flagellar operon FliA
MDPKDVLLLHIQLVDDLARAVCRRYAVYGEDQRDFASSVKLRLIEDDYALVRRFEGRSEFGTYLAAVVYKVFCEYRNANWGRRRPSVNAMRLGPFAVRLELLMQWKGCTLGEATEILRSAGERVPRPRELARIAALLQSGKRARKGRTIDELVAAESSDGLAIQGEWEQLRATVHAALDRAMQGLSREDELILWLHYWEGLSVSDIARTLRLRPGPLYRRIRGMYPHLRTALESMGVREELVDDLLQTADEAS